MIFFKNFFLFLLIFSTLRYFFIKSNFLLSKFVSKHQKLIGNEKVPLIGGTLFFIFQLLNHNYFENYYLFFSFALLILGIFSDLNYLNSPKKRLLIQFLIILFFVILQNVYIEDLRNEFINKILLNTYTKYIFITFCLLILVNGSNFIDGCNGLNIGYFLLILISISFLNYHKIEIQSHEIINLTIMIFLLLCILNMMNLLYLGDSGAYIVSFYIGYVLIKLYVNNPNLSPYFIALLLWYPAFENLFSIIRKKFSSNVSPINPDNNHLHQMVFKYLNKKFNIYNNLSNPISSILINLYNFLIFIIGINIFNNSKLLIFLILLNLLIYLIIYFFLKKALTK